MPTWLIQIVVGIVLAVASTLIKQAAPASQQQAAGIRSTYQTGGVTPESFVVGTFGLLGKLEYENTWGTSGQTPNAYLTQVISLSDVACSGLTGIFADSERQTLTGTGHVAQGYPVTGSRAGFLWYEFFDGTQTTASSFLTSQFGADANRPWLSDMIGRGVAYINLTALYDRTVWSGTPTYMVEVQGIKLYDPRQDSTAGGSGSQRRADDTTWAFSDNPAVVIYNILIGIRYAGAWLWGMQDYVDPSRLPYDVWAAAMDACDESVALEAGGSEKRFRVGREITLDEKPIDVITDLLTSCNARISEAAGVYSIIVGAPGAAVGSLSDEDVVITEASSLEPFPALDTIVNGATATYLEPSQAWASKDAVPYYRSDLEAEDDGRRQAQSLPLTSVFSGTQAQRVLKATVEDGRRFYQHVLVLRPGYGLYQPLDVLTFTSTKNGYTAKSFLVTSTEEGPNCNVVVGLQEIDASDHDWSAGTDEKAYSYTPMTPVRPATQVLTGWTVFPADFVDNTGTSRKPGIAVTWDSGQADVRAIFVSVREKNSAKIEWSGEFNYDAFPSGGTVPHAFLPDTTYQAQGDYIPYSGRLHTPSAWLDVTTTNLSDITDVLLASLGQDTIDFLAWTGALARSDRGSLIDAAIQQASQDFSNLSDFQSLQRGIVSSQGQMRAEFAEAILVATGPDSAFAEAITSLYVAMGGSSSGVNIRYSSSYTPAAGFDARYGLEVYSDVGSVFNAAGIFFDVSSAGAKTIIVGDEVAIGKSDGSVYAFWNSDGEVVNGTLRGPSSANYWDLATGDMMVSDL